VYPEILRRQDHAVNNPWISAIAFSGFKAAAFGITSTVDLADTIVSFLHSDHGLGANHLEYDHVNGASRYVGFVPIYDATSGELLGWTPYFKATSYMLLGDGQVVNCDDQAFAAKAFIAIACDAAMETVYVDQFGYIHQTTFVGNRSSNNPFYRDEECRTLAVVDADATALDVVQEGNKEVRVRSFFGYHMFLWISGVGMFDACVGSITSSDSATTTAAYLAITRDTSTTEETEFPDLSKEYDEDEELDMISVGSTAYIRSWVILT
jgi:hypothetical protein